MDAWIERQQEQLASDPRLRLALQCLNGGDWYQAHDAFEELWHETAGPHRPVLQGLLQLAVSQLHLERGNRHGAMVLLGESLGRLSLAEGDGLGLDLQGLCEVLGDRLRALQTGDDSSLPALPALGCHGKCRSPSVD